jgi:hypothetical protein
MNHLPPSHENNTKIILNFSKIRGDIRKSRCTTSGKFATSVNNTGSKTSAGINGTGSKFATGINYTGSKFCNQFRWCCCKLANGVNNAGGK